MNDSVSSGGMYSTLSNETEIWQPESLVGLTEVLNKGGDTNIELLEHNKSLPYSVVFRTAGWCWALNTFGS